MKNYLKNSIGWLGLFIVIILLALLGLTSCEKEQVSPNKISITNISKDSLIGNYVYIDTVYKQYRKQISIFKRNTTYYMTNPDQSLSVIKDTIVFTLYNNFIDIPHQETSSSDYIQGIGYLYSDSIKLYFNCKNGGAFLGIIYMKQ